MIKRAGETGKQVIAGAGENLYLRAAPSGAARWVVIKHMDGKNRERALGRYPETTLAVARAQVPAIVAKLERKLARIRTPDAPTKFHKFAEWYFDNHHRPGLSSTKGVEMWRLVLGKYLKPLGHLRVEQIRPHHVAEVLTSLTDRPAMMRDVRGKLAIVLEAARALGLTNTNAADWSIVKFHIPGAAVKGRKSYRSEHHGALELDHMPALMGYLRARDTMAAQCLEWLILTTTRSTEARAAMVEEIDLDAAIWAIDPARMKKGILHRIPLSPRAIEIAGEAIGTRTSGLLFPGRSGTKPVSDQTLRDLVFGYECHELGRAAPRATVHGFRACFGSWGQRQGYADEVLDRQLSHVADAYLRDDVLEIRREILKRWQSALV
ncbi:integrase family protein [Roseibium sp. TrichSKD4]|uniref:tyrosine-type recombinase/integrase n=1 Tax=Roseibium sp. TrichSKD4 TaxID=744980 RepID=UPI0001E56F2D|nr:site-specific integrase [Roseibium sp. TrichSKD4]EFO31304.1 integrase family protein [Roseibium sp. TrichSKD4]